MPRILRPLLALTLVAVACEQTAASSSGSPPSGQASSVSVADPLVGRWHQEYSCHDLVHVLRREARPAEFRRYVTGLIGEQEGVSTFPSLPDPCAGAPASFERIAQFAGSNLVFFDPPNLQDNGLHATYEVVDDHTFVVNDTMDNVRPSPLKVNFMIEGDTVTFRVHSDELYTVAGFEAAPWIRMD